MELAAKEDIEAPISVVFDTISQFNTLERRALRRGAEVVRTDDLTEPGVGMGWKLAFKFRGKLRKMRIKIVEYDAPNRMMFVSESPNIKAKTTMEFFALSRKRTRMNLEVSVQAKNLSTRLVMQSLKLARGNIDRRFRLRVADYAKDLEDRCADKVA